MRKIKHHSRRNKKGGFFFNKPKVQPYSAVQTSSMTNDCDVNNLPTLTKMPDVNDETGQLKPLDERLNDLKNMNQSLQNNYMKCCPKGFMGKKNTSPYCNQLDATFRSVDEHRRDITGYYGDETNVSKIKEVMDAPVVELPSPKKPWYKFWGGKKSRRHRKRSHKRRSHRRR